ncbi:hypothetical protein ACG04R_22840 [Roseateles sp. BYS78W]|uniref:Uncharacterized protein n=1 Tax=Pelomonas candidula TaxID=3299025 RepID=A0ABW7HHY7_9BURK
MPLTSDNAAPADTAWAAADILSITLRQLRAWDEEATRQRVTQPRADEDAWEGTEIDVRRTVL